MKEIHEAVKPLAEKYEIKTVDLFGSYAKQTATENSDVDLLVSFIKPVPSIFEVMGFREEVMIKLSTPVDVVTLPLVRPEKINIEGAINIYARA